MSDLKVLRPSSADQWMHCALSPHLSEGVSDDAGEPAREGTRVHYLIETCIKAAHFEAEHCIGATLTVPNLGQFVVTAEQARNATVFLQHVRSILALDKEAELYCERRVHAYAGQRYQVSGTTDCLVYLPTFRHLYVIDYKNGRVLVDVVGHWQTRIYGQGGVRHLHNRQIETVTTTIVQPRVHHVDGPIRSETFDALDLAEHHIQIAAAVAAVEAPNPKGTIGEHCGYCKGAARCPALMANADQTKVNPFGEIVHQTSIQPVYQMTPEELGRRLAGLKALEAYITALKKHALASASRGQMPAGYKLIRSRPGNRRWKYESDRVLDLAYLATGEDISEKIILSPTKAEEKIGKENYKLIADLVERPEGGIQLAPIDDPAPALQLSPGCVFDVIEHKG